MLWLVSMGFWSVVAQDSIVCQALIQKGIDDMMHVRYASAITSLTQAQQMARQSGSAQQQFLSANNLGLTYYKMMDYGRALTYYLQAYELALLQKNPVNEMTVLNNIAIVYIKTQKMDQAESYFLKSLEIAKKHKIDTRIGYYATNLAQLYLDMKRYDVADTYIQLALPKLKSEPRVLLSAKVISSRLLLVEKKYKAVISQAKALLREAKVNQYEEEQTEIYLLLAAAYQQIFQWDEAMFHISQGLQVATHDDLRIRLYELQAVLALQRHQVELAVASKDSILTLVRRVHETQNKALLDHTALRFELTASKHALEINEVESKNRQQVYLLSIVLLVLVLVVLVVVFYKRHILIKQKRIIDAHDLKIKNLELTQEKNNRRLLENEVAVKNKMLSDKMLFQTTRNEFISNLVDTLSKDTYIQNHVTLQKAVRDLKNHLKEDGKWEEFMTNFENVNNTFIQNLKTKHTQLNANDLRFLSFIYLNLNTKEIASLLHISPESCRKRKERLVKKLELEPNVSLYQYVSTLA